MTGLPFPEVSPIMFSIGPLAIRWYSMAYLVGIVVGWWFVLKKVQTYKLSLTKEQIEDFVFYITIGIIVGGRFGYALFYGGAEMWLKPSKILIAVSTSLKIT